MDRNLLERVPGTAYRKTAYRKATGGKQKPPAREVYLELGRERRKKVLEYLKRYKRISNPILRREFHLPQTTAYRLLKKLEAAGLIRELPGRSNREAIYEYMEP